MVILGGSILSLSSLFSHCNQNGRTANKYQDNKNDGRKK